MEKIRVVIADDMEEIRNLFKVILKNSEEIEIVGEAHDDESAYELVKIHKPDVVLMDIEMDTKYSGIEITRWITENFPEIKVIILTMHDDDDIFVNSYVVGAKAFLLKNSATNKIISTIKDVYEDRYILDNAGTKKVLNRLSQYATERHSLLFMMNILGTLTKTEMEILKSLYVGKSYKDIAKDRYIEKKTLENHITSILKKFNAKSAKQLVSELRELKIFDYSLKENK